MSYDLYLYPRDAAADSDFALYFAGRAHYALSRDGRVAAYQNPGTGVYFEFTYLPSPPARESVRAGDRAAAARQRPRGSIHFNLNYMRPHVFAVEAVDEVAALVHAFHCTIQDDQIEGMGRGPFTREGFVRSWNTGNRFGYKVFQSRVTRKNDPDDLQKGAERQGLLVASSQRIADVWGWNYRLASVQAMLERDGQRVFVPRVAWGQEISSREAVTFVVWGPNVPTVVPGVASHVLVGRGPARTGLLARLIPGARQRAERFLLVERERLLAMAPVRQVKVGGRSFTYCPVGGGVFEDAFYTGLARGSTVHDPAQLVRMVEPDGVLDADIFEELVS